MQREEWRYSEKGTVCTIVWAKMKVYSPIGEANGQETLAIATTCTLAYICVARIPGRGIPLCGASTSRGSRRVDDGGGARERERVIRTLSPRPHTVCTHMRCMGPIMWDSFVMKSNETKMGSEGPPQLLHRHACKGAAIPFESRTLCEGCLTRIPLCALACTHTRGCELSRPWHTSSVPTHVHGV